jgi:hypothetical protein
MPSIAGFSLSIAAMTSSGTCPSTTYSSRTRV